MKTKVVQILIRRSLASTPSDVVLAHEVPILKVIRGAGAIEIIEENCKDFDLKPGKVNPRDELIRLKNKYKGFINEGQHPVDIAFPDGSRDLELFYKKPELFEMTEGEDVGGVIDDQTENEILNDGGDEDEDVAEVPPPAPAADSAAESSDAPESSTTESVLGNLELPAAAPQIDLNDRPAVVAELTRLEVPFAKTTATKHLATLLTNSLEAGATGAAE